ncbi:ATP-binding protein [Lachnospiraceae bacterium ZAX-1]
MIVPIMSEDLPDIPRIYSAIAEWSACLTCILFMRERLKGWKLVGICAVNLVLQFVFWILTEGVPVSLWIPSMIAAAGLMYAFIKCAGCVNATGAGYECARAFVLAELAASLEWQVHCYLWPANDAKRVWAVALLLGTYVAVFYIVSRLEKKYTIIDNKIGITRKEWLSVTAIGITIFAVSNLSFVTINTPFSGQYGREIFNIRTIVDLGGLAFLYAYHIQCHDHRAQRSLGSMQNILNNQYAQYQQSKESVDIINRKYHDMKHQIAILRAEKSDEARNAYLDEMEEDIKAYEAENKTGNAVLDILLTSKSLYCSLRGISFTCVADGTLLNFMDVMDICTIFGNALDNAIEYTEKIEDFEKRLIHVTVFHQKGFLVIRFENYYEGRELPSGELPKTSKKDKDYHGFGLKSIRFIAQKYDGTATVDINGCWFELKILIPLVNG